MAIRHRERIAPVPMRSLAIALVLLIGSASIGVAQDRPLWIPQQITSQNGLPQNSVNDLALDSVGNLLMTTEGGLVRSDGYRFEGVALPFMEASAQDRVREIIPVVDGSFLVTNSSGDRYLLRNMEVVGAWRRWQSSIALRKVKGVVPSEMIHRRLLERVDTLDGAHRWSGPVLRVWTQDAHTWTIAGPEGLLTYTDSTLVRFVRTDKVLGGHFRSMGQWYALDADRRLVRIDPVTGRTGQVQVQGIDQEVLDRALRTTFPSQQGGTQEALLRSGQTVIMLRTARSGAALVAEELPLVLPSGCLINKLLWSDRFKVLFVGTDTKGLFIYRAHAMRTLVCEPSPWGSNHAYYAMHPLGGDSVLALSNGYRTLFTDKGCTNTVDEGRVPLNYQTAHALPNGHLLLGRHNVLVEYDPRTGAEQEWFRIPGEVISALLLRGDSLWVGNSQGIGILAYGKYRRLVSAHTVSSFLWIDDRLWAATCHGVIRVTPAGAVDTLAGIPKSCVRTIEPIGDRIFIGTYGKGGYVLVGGRVLQLPLDKQGFLTHVHSFAADGYGMLWMSTNRGLFRVKMVDLEAWIKDPTRHLYYAYYGQEDGILNPEFNGGCEPPYVRMADGNLAFPSLEGIVKFDPAAVLDPVPTGPIRLASVRLDGMGQDPSTVLEFPPDHDELSIQLSLPYWGSQANVQLEYELSGFQAEWRSIPVGEREVRFSRLPPGSYVLRVRKLGSPDAEPPTELRFEVRAPFYRQRWFLALAGLLTGLLFYVALRINEHRLRRRNQELESAVRGRTREIEQANERLQRSVELKEKLVSIISHDIVTPLRFIARVARSTARRQADAPGLSESLNDIAVSSDKLYANAHNMLSWIKHQEGRIEIRPMHVALNPLVEEALDVVRALAASQGDTLVNEVPLDDVLHTDRDVLLIILQNLISNAVNYTRQGNVVVHGTLRGDHYELSVSDTGPGISPKALAHVRDILSGQHGRRGMDHGDPEMQGLGYVIIGELTGLLGGSVEVAPREGGGTQVTLRLPLRMEHTGQVQEEPAP